MGDRTTPAQACPAPIVGARAVAGLAGGPLRGPGGLSGEPAGRGRVGERLRQIRLRLRRDRLRADT